MKKILVPIDFSAASEKAVRYVAEVFAGHEVVILHVNQSGQSKDEIDSEFRRFESEFLKSTELAYDFVIAEGKLLDEIQAQARHIGPDYIILGTHTHGVALAKALVKLTQCPVLVVPEHSRRDGIKKIAYANDFNDIKNSEALIPLMKLSQAFGAKVYIIHVNQGREVLSDRAEASLEYYLEKIDHEYVHIPAGDIELALNAYLAEKDIDLLTVLLRDHGSNNLQSNGRLVEEIVSNTRLPVLNLV